jgi:hypothetical protein
MSTTIQLGGHGSLELNGSADNLRFPAERAESPSVDATLAVVDSLFEPLEFPPLESALVLDDRVAIAVGSNLPQMAEIVKGAVRAFERAGIESSAINVVLADASDEAILQGQLGAAQVTVHDPADATQLCFVGLTSAGRELRINRQLYEADFVLPLTCARHREEHDERGVFDGLFPRFADEETIRRFRQLESWTSASRNNALTKETAEAGWLIGAPLVVEVVPQRGNRVAAVLAGEPEAVAAEAQRRCNRVWASKFTESAGLVVAVVTGDRREHTWDNLARALAAAAKVADEDAAVAIVCDIDLPLGKSLARLIRADDREVVRRKLAGDTSDDNWFAWELVQALDRGPVYLLSGLDAEKVEELGVAPIASKEELGRLVSRSSSCIVLEDAQHVVASIS